MNFVFTIKQGRSILQYPRDEIEYLIGTMHKYLCNNIEWQQVVHSVFYTECGFDHSLLISTQMTDRYLPTIPQYICWCIMYTDL